MRTSVFLLATFALPAAAKDKPIVQVQVVYAKTQTWATTWRDNGSPGTQSTDCTAYGDTSVSCTTTTKGYRAPQEFTIPHIRVDVTIKMSDGSTVAARCQDPSVWENCMEPPLGTYGARIEKRNLHLFVPKIGRPEYSPDGTVKKTGKTSTTDVKFNFE